MDSTYDPPLALTIIGTIFIGTALLFSIWITYDIVRRQGWKTMMAIMIPVYIVNALYLAPITLWTYLNYGRPPKPTKEGTKDEIERDSRPADAEKGDMTNGHSAHGDHEGHDMGEHTGHKMAAQPMSHEGHNHEGHVMAGHEGQDVTNHAGHDMSGHEGHDMGGHGGHDMTNHEGHDMTKHEQHNAHEMEGHDMSKHEGHQMSGHEGHDMSKHAGHDMSGHDMSGHDMGGHGAHGGHDMASHGGHDMHMHMHMMQDRPMFATITVAVCHCGAGCLLGDIVGEWLVWGVGAQINGRSIWVEWLVDYGFALLFGIIFQYWSIAPMSGEYGPKTLIRAAKADFLSLTFFEVGLFGWMAIFQLAIWKGRLQMDNVVYWWMMQVGMFLGHWTAFPINWWLITQGIKEPCA